jgi:pimeloyl-ACP methyl ester carboxylesterase
MFHVRSTTSFSSEGTRCDAWLDRPDTGAASVPIVVMAHGLGGTKTMRLGAFAERFCAAGYACLVFDYRHFGASDGEPRQLLSVARQLADWEAAVAHARSLPGVDPGRVILWGTSFGGGHVLSMAARDDRLAAVIAQCPFTDGVASSMAVPTATGARVTAAALRDRLGARRGAAPIYLPAAADPGTPAFMSSPDARSGVESIIADAPDHENRLTARSAIDVLLYSPGRGAREIRCPLLVALCGHDTVAPSRTAHRQLSRAPRAELHTYPIGHFDIYLGEPFERAVADYLAFLHRHVPVDG